MAASFLELSEEQQRDYLPKAHAAVPAELEIAGIIKNAKRAAIAWTSKIVGEIDSNVSEACAIAIELGYLNDGNQEDMVMESREEEEEAPLLPRQSLTAKPLALQPLEVFGEDEKRVRCQIIMEMEQRR